MKLLRVVVLTLTLSGSTYAGVIQNGITQPQADPATAQATTEQTPTVTEIILAVVSALGLI